MKTIFFRFFFAIAFVSTIILRTYHTGVLLPPVVNEIDATVAQDSFWLDRSEVGINQLILKGPAYQRGLMSGKLTAGLLKRQEDELVGTLNGWLNSKILLQTLILSAITWYQGIDKYLEPWMLEEMYGVSKSAPREYDYLVDGYTRQVAYHGLHEVGQMAVDEGFESMGCTVAATPWKNNWILGRNFDFEGGRIFDSEKIMKWVFPESGHAYVSIIWAGMVGAVTGINDQGLYISINAAGSSDFARLGMPSTLVLLKVLQNAGTAAEALEILEKEQMFITDIFVLLDTKLGKLFRVEKSPKKMAVIPHEKATLIANHLISPIWQADSINDFRRDQLTSLAREERGQKLLDDLSKQNIQTDAQMENAILKIIRDKGAINGQPLHLGNRKAIDALIATHAVIYNGNQDVLYVSQGPGLTGKFLGFSLKESFRQKKPIQIEGLPVDPILTTQQFERINKAQKYLVEAKHLIDKKKCEVAKDLVFSAKKLFQDSSLYYETLGDLKECLGETVQAKNSWSTAQLMHPPYMKTVKKLQNKMNGIPWEE